MITKLQGDSVTLTAIFSDKNGKTVPLAGLPTCVDPAGKLSFSPVGIPTVNDPQFQWTATVPTDCPPGDYPINISAEGDPTPGQDTVSGSYTITVAADEDTQVAISAQ